MKFFVDSKKGLKGYRNPLRGVALSNVYKGGGKSLHIGNCYCYPPLRVLVYMYQFVMQFLVSGPINAVWCKTNTYYSVHLFHQRYLPTVLATSASPAQGRIRPAESWWCCDVIEILLCGGYLFFRNRPTICF